jgi:ribosomal protein S10
LCYLLGNFGVSEETLENEAHSLDLRYNDLLNVFINPSEMQPKHKIEKINYQISRQASSTVINKNKPLPAPSKIINTAVTSNQLSNQNKFSNYKNQNSITATKQIVTKIFNQAAHSNVIVNKQKLNIQNNVIQQRPPVQNYFQRPPVQNNFQKPSLNINPQRLPLINNIQKSQVINHVHVQISPKPITAPRAAINQPVKNNSKKAVSDDDDMF